MKAIKLSLATAALAAGTLLLSGCEPSNTAGSSGTSGGVGVTCDSNGFGPLSGCDNADGSGPTSSSPEPTGADTASCEADMSSRDPDAGVFNDTKDGSEKTSTDENSCQTDNRPELEQEDQTEDQKITETTEHRVTVTVTWIVVNIDVTGFRECVIELREAQQDADDQFSRRITTPEDCKAQQIDAVYRPVNK